MGSGHRHRDARAVGDAIEDILGQFHRLSAREGVEVRFIELMNTGSACEYTRAHFVAGAEVVQRLKAEPVPRRSAQDPAALYRARGVVFGVIASDTAPFCAACDRLRLSASGLLRSCLYAPPGLDVGALLRGGASLSQLRTALRVALAEKQSHHPSQPLARAPFSMAAVGGRAVRARGARGCSRRRAGAARRATRGACA